MRVRSGVCTRSTTGAASVYISASEPSERMKSSRAEFLWDRQAAAPTPSRPIIISVMPTSGTMYVALTCLPPASDLDVDHAADDPEAQRHEPGRPDEDDETGPVQHGLEVSGILQFQR